MQNTPHISPSKIQALIRLLEDPDPRINSVVKAKLVSYGKIVLPHIEEAWHNDIQCTDHQERTIEVLRHIQVDDLKKLRLDKAKSLITALPSDADNLFVVLSARQFNKNFTIISRASNESSYGKLKIAGATNVIMPDKLGGAHMASLVVTPDLIEFIDRLTIAGNKNANLEEISVNSLPKEYFSKTILDLDLRKKTGCSVIGFKTSLGEYLINPDANIKLEKDTYLIVLGNKEQINRLREIF